MLERGVCLYIVVVYYCRIFLVKSCASSMYVYYCIEKILFRYGELVRPLTGRWPPLRTGAGHGRPGRPPSRCGCAVTSLLQRDGGGAVCFRQEIWLPAQPVVVARRRGQGCGGGGAGGGVGAPRAALGGRTHRLCLDAARIRGGGGCCDGAGERGERRRGHPPVVDGRRRGAG